MADVEVPLTGAEAQAEIGRLTARVEELQNLCAAMYQFAGEVGAPERVLDVLAAAQNGDPLPEEAIDAILPITAAECDAFAGEKGSGPC
jgi:hypothetical protein